MSKENKIKWWNVRVNELFLVLFKPFKNSIEKF
jgi:hypothetical protein